MDFTKTIAIVTATTMLLMACSVSAEPTQAIPEEPTEAISSGPRPGIEIVKGPPDSCVMVDTSQSTLAAFDVIYHDLGRDFYMVGVLSAPDTGEIGHVGTATEGYEGEAGWGMYPEAYDLPANTPITLEITVHAGSDEAAPVSSTSSLVYDCSTGVTISTSFDNSSD